MTNKKSVMKCLSVLLILLISLLLVPACTELATTGPQSVTVNGVQINYVEQGSGDETVIFVHGYTEAISHWTKVLELLPEEYHAYALDLRGHGQSGQPGSYQLPEFVEDIYAFTQELGLERFTYIGHSMGGKIGYQFALDHPDVLKGLFLVAPTLAHDYMSPDERAAFAASVKSAFESPDMTRSLLAQQFTTPLSEELLSELSSDMIAADPVAREKIVDWMIGTNLEPELRNIRVPTLILAAADDPFGPPDLERRYASQIEGCRFEAWAYGGHMIALDSPQKLVDLLVSFIEDVSKR